MFKILDLKTGMVRIEEGHHYFITQVGVDKDKWRTFHDAFRQGDDCTYKFEKEDREFSIDVTRDRITASLTVGDLDIGDLTVGDRDRSTFRISVSRQKNGPNLLSTSRAFMISKFQ